MSVRAIRIIGWTLLATGLALWFVPAVDNFLGLYLLGPLVGLVLVLAGIAFCAAAVDPKTLRKP